MRLSSKGRLLDCVVDVSVKMFRREVGADSVTGLPAFHVNPNSDDFSSHIRARDKVIGTSIVIR